MLTLLWTALASWPSRVWAAPPESTTTTTLAVPEWQDEADRVILLGQVVGLLLIAALVLAVGVLARRGGR